MSHRSMLGAVALPTPGHLAHLARTRVRPPALPSGSVDEILARYGWRALGPAANLAGRRNDNLLVPTTGGDKVLRRHRPGWQRTSVDHEHAILVELEHLDFPAVRVERTTDGDTVVDRHGRLHALFRYEHGVNLTGWRTSRRRDAAALTAAGAALARFHQALAGFEPSERHHTDDHPDGEDGPDTASPALDRSMVDTLVRIADVEALLAGADLPETVIHSDFGLHNLLFRPDGDPIVLDLELARRGRRLSDLLIVLGRLSARDGESFGAGYAGVGPLTDDEIQLAPLVWELDCLRGGLRSWRNHQLHGDAQRLRTARRRLERATTPPPLPGGMA
jgi:Ser/Thr protein kinase RdoA (MazF antagonist)